MEKIRHSLAHLLAYAVLQKFPDVKPASGPVCENGFYYDFDFGEKKITPKDLKELQKIIKKTISKKLDFKSKELSKQEALDFYKDNPYKKDFIEDIIQKGEKILFYDTGDIFSDLCAGPHVRNTSEIDPSAFELTKISGAYFKGDEKNPMLVRIYGVAFENKESLTEHKALLEEAKKRDHRKIGKELGLFVSSELVGSGLPLFAPKGVALREAITEEISALQEKYNWQRVCTPHITKKELYEISGHWKKFKDELFKVSSKSAQDFVMKPMNCPHHTQIYASSPRSYKELPIRYAENGVVYRDEQAGELLGLSRVRAITQDDGHCFCTPEQVESEIKNIVSVIKNFYTKLGMFKKGDFWVSLSVHDPNCPEKYMITEDGLFLEAEKILEKIAKEENLPYKKVEGEAAFYGPKLDFQFKDALAREWQLGTVQLDFSMPKRFSLQYVNKDGKKKTPVMIHRAVAGSLERFMSIIIEHFAGAFPFWLSPVQVKIIPVAEEHLPYAEKIFEKIKKEKYRVEIDKSQNSFGKKIRDVKKEKVPYFIIIGSKDIEEEKLTLESRDTNTSQQLSIKELLEQFKKES